MSAYVFVHGAWHGAWCWDKVVSLLERAGHKAIALDLPGHGRDDTPITRVTFEAYCNKVREIVEAQPEPVILVGHSMGGRVVTQVAELRPDKIKTLVYLAAILLRNDENTIPADPDTGETFIDRSVITSDDGIYQTLREDAIKELLFHDCSDEDTNRAMALLESRQASQPFTIPMRLTNENFGRVRKVYIECLQDKAVTPAQQRIMYTLTPCDKVISMSASHSPFLSSPQELANHLVSISKYEFA
ncbi:MAG: alpha/beta fold hydrolase [Candidatus Binataceae bacterium]